MGLQPDQAVEDLHAGFLQIARPANIGSLVEAGLDLDHDGHFFFGGGFDQRTYDGRIFAGAIERLLDRKNVWIVRGAFDEADNRAIGIVGMMQQEMFAPDYFTRASTPNPA